MTAPRRVLPGTTYLVTRRCTQRQFLLKPSRITNEVFLYVLAVAALRYGVRVHAFCVLSNHYHLVVTDAHGRLPAFQQFLDSLVARALNARWGHWEEFWSRNSFSAVELVAPRDVIDKTAYTLANPVMAGLVRSARKWPGLWSSPELIGSGAFEVRRPRHFFDREGTLPESLSLRLSTPPGFQAESFREQLVPILADKERAAAKAASGFLGVARVLAQRATARPQSTEPRRQLNPRIAARDKWKRMEALARLATFLSEYRSALIEWRMGRREVLFPEGTYLLRVGHGASCAGAG